MGGTQIYVATDRQPADKWTKGREAASTQSADEQISIINQTSIKTTDKLTTGKQVEGRQRRGPRRLSAGKHTGEKRRQAAAKNAENKQAGCQQTDRRGEPQTSGWQPDGW